MVELLLTVIVCLGVLVVEEVEAYVDAERIDGAVAYAYAEVCGDVSGNLLAVSILADSLDRKSVV